MTVDKEVKCMFELSKSEFIFGIRDANESIVAFFAC